MSKFKQRQALAGLDNLRIYTFICPVYDQCHFYVASKAPWFEINDDLPKYAELPPRSGNTGRITGPKRMNRTTRN